jgi:hypothetical protein
LPVTAASSIGAARMSTGNRKDAYILLLYTLVRRTWTVSPAVHRRTNDVHKFEGPVAHMFDRIASDIFFSKKICAIISINRNT